MAKKKASGLYGQQTGVSLAQSGGRNTTFGGGKGGVPLSKGVTHDKTIDHGRLNSGTGYTLRADTGNNTPYPAKRTVGKPPPVHPGGKGVTKIIKPTIRRPAVGGSR